MTCTMSIIAALLLVADGGVHTAPEGRAYGVARFVAVPQIAMLSMNLT